MKIVLISDRGHFVECGGKMFRTPAVINRDGLFDDKVMDKLIGYLDFHVIEYSIQYSPGSEPIPTPIPDTILTNTELKDLIDSLNFIDLNDTPSSIIDDKYIMTSGGKLIFTDLGEGINGGIDGGSSTSIYLISQNINGGSSTSIY